MRPFIFALATVVAATCVRAAETDPTNVQLFQRNAQGRLKPIDMLGSQNLLKVLGFDANGILGPIDVLTQDEWTAQLASLTTALGLKANIASPNFTGTPGAPTAAPGTNTTQLATTAFVTAAVNSEASTRSAADIAEAATRAAADAAEAATRATIDANKADLFHTHVAAEITDGGAVGLPLVRTNTAAEARALIGPFVVADGDKGDITVSGTGATYSIDNDAVTMAKLANIAGASLIGRSGAGSGDPEVVSVDPSYFTMSGASFSLAHVNAALIDSGTLPDGRFPATLPAASGVNLTALNASNLGSGTVPDARFPASLPAVSGVNLTNLTEANLTGARRAFSALTTNAGGTTALAVNGGYYDTVTASTTLSVTGTVANGSWVVWFPTVSSGPITVTLPASTYRVGGTSTIASINLENGNHWVALERINSTWVMRDSGVDKEVVATFYGNFTASLAAPTFTGVHTVLGVLEAARVAQDAGANDSYSISPTPAMLSYTTGAHYRFKANTANFGAATININALGAKTIKKLAGGITTDLEDNDIRAGQWVDLVYDGTNMQMMSARGNKASFVDEVKFNRPDQCDGTGAVRVTAEGATVGHATFSNSADKAANYVIYRFQLPYDFDPNVDLVATFTQRLGGADTGKQAYEISMADVNSSASVDAPTFGSAVAINFAGDASGASTDIEISSATTLTGWKTSLTAGHWLVIKLARDGDDATNDTSTVNSTDMGLTIQFGRRQ